MTLFNISSTRRIPILLHSTQNPTTWPVTLYNAEAILPDVIEGSDVKIVEGILNNAQNTND